MPIQNPALAELTSKVTPDQAILFVAFPSLQQLSDDDVNILCSMIMGSPHIKEVRIDYGVTISPEAALDLFATLMRSNYLTSLHIAPNAIYSDDPYKYQQLQAVLNDKLSDYQAEQLGDLLNDGLHISKPQGSSQNVATPPNKKFTM